MRVAAACFCTFVSASCAVRMITSLRSGSGSATPGWNVQGHLRLGALGKDIHQGAEHLGKGLRAVRVRVQRAHRGAQLVQALPDLRARGLHHPRGARGLGRDEARGPFQEHRRRGEPVAHRIVHLPREALALLHDGHVTQPALGARELGKELLAFRARLERAAEGHGKGDECKEAHAVAQHRGQPVLVSASKRQISSATVAQTTHATPLPSGSRMPTIVQMTKKRMAP